MQVPAVDLHQMLNDLDDGGSLALDEYRNASEQLGIRNRREKRHFSCISRAFRRLSRARRWLFARRAEFEVVSLAVRTSAVVLANARAHRRSVRENASSVSPKRVKVFRIVDANRRRTLLPAELVMRVPTKRRVRERHAFSDE